MKPKLTLEASTRHEQGKGAAGRLRRQGVLPCSLYGNSVGNLAIQVPVKEVEHIITQSGPAGLIILQLKGAEELSGEFLVILREVQRHPVRGNLMHIDFYQVSNQELMTTEVSIHLIGDSPGVELGGILQAGIRHVEVECLPAALPDALEVDISALEIGMQLTVADLQPPPGVKVLVDPETIVVKVLAPANRELEEEADIEEPVAE